MKALVLTLSVVLASCSVMDTSFYDDNESMLAVNVRFAVNKLDCGNPGTVFYLNDTIEKLSLYSESKKSKDVYPLVGKMKETAKGIEGSSAVCNLKKKILVKQSSDIANAIMRRF